MKNEQSIWRFPGARPMAWLVMAYLYIPIVILMALSFSEGDSSLSFGEGFGLRWYDTVLSDGSMMKALKNSAIVGVSATIAGTAISVMAALATSRTKFRGQRLVETSLGLPLVIPEIVAAIAILLLFVGIGMPLGLGSLILAHIVFAVPISYLPIRARMQDLDPSLAEAAADLYARPWLIFRRITLPLVWPGIVSGAMLAFIGSLGDVVISYFVSGPGSTTLPVYIYGMVRVGVTPAVNAISTLIIVVSVMLLLSSHLLGRSIR